jgi:hypothetical protein
MVMVFPGAGRQKVSKGIRLGEASTSCNPFGRSSGFGN